MRILLIHPNYHSGGAEIAGNWPPAWAAYISGALKSAGYRDVAVHRRDDLQHDDAALEAKVREARPDVVMATAITPAIYKAQETLRWSAGRCPRCRRCSGASTARSCTGRCSPRRRGSTTSSGRGRGSGGQPGADARGGEPREGRRGVKGIAFVEQGGEVVTTPANPPIQDLDALTPDWDMLELGALQVHPAQLPPRGAQLRARLSLHLQLLLAVEVLAHLPDADPVKFVDEIELLVKKHKVGFFILADEEPTIHRKKFVQLCEELVKRDLGVKWGINTRVTDILRDEALLPLYRKAGLVHVSLGTEAAAQLKLDRFNKEIKLEQSKKAIRLLREHGIVTEAQFIVGLENETPETLEETYRMALDWKADLVNWNCYTPWPFSDLSRSWATRSRCATSPSTTSSRRSCSRSR